MSILRRLAIALLALLAASCGERKKDSSSSVKEEQGVVGTTCYADPVVNATNGGGNVCSRPDSNWPGLERGQLFYGPLVPYFIAKSSALQACHDANALDSGIELGGKSCFKTCDEVVSCLPFTPNPD